MGWYADGVDAREEGEGADEYRETVSSGYMNLIDSIVFNIGDKETISLHFDFADFNLILVEEVTVQYGGQIRVQVMCHKVPFN